MVRVVAPVRLPSSIRRDLVFTGKSDADLMVTDTASIQLTVKQAVVDMVKTAATQTLCLWSLSTILLRVSNSGAVQAYNVLVKDTLPAGLRT